VIPAPTTAICSVLRASATGEIFPEAIQGARDLNSPADGADADYWSSVVESRLPAGGTLWRAHSDAVNARLLERWLPAEAGLRILKTDLFDEAVAPGVYPLLAERAARVVGIDISPAVVAAAARRYPGLEALVADVRRLPFAEGTFDVVVSVSTLDHFETAADLEAGLAELRRVLVPGGTLVVTLDNGRNPVVALRNRLPLGILRRAGVVPYFVGATYGPQRLQRVLVESGFDVKEVTVVLHCPRALAVLGSSLLEGGAGETGRRRYLRFLRGFERLERAPTRSLTGYFAAARATRT
jgi:SAM-dependent methyltransferase